MNANTKTAAVVMTLLLLAAIPAYVFLAMSKTPDTAPKASNFQPTPTKIVPIPGDAEVTITAGGFFPDTISVEAGHQVVWKNTDSAQHQPMTDPHPKDDGYPGFVCPEPLGPGDSFGFTFEKPGTYTYHDQANPLSLGGTVIVR